MSANHLVFEATVKTTAATAIAQKAAAAVLRQSSIDAATTVVGFRPGWPAGYSSAVAAFTAASAQKAIDEPAAEQLKQSGATNARDVLVTAGEQP